MKITILRRGFFSRLTWGFFFVGLLVFAAPSYAEEIQVYSADPSSADQGTYDLEVTVAGDNFGADSEVDFFVADTSDPGGIKVKKVKRQGPKTLKVTIDVDPDAQTEFDFDICVRSRGRTGKGTEMFRVLKKEKPPEPQWEVEIPSCGDSDLNLCGWNMTTYVETSDEDGVAVDVATGRDDETGLQVSEFTLVVFMCEWPDACFVDMTQPDQLTLRNFVFGAYELGEGPACIFPEQSMSECGPEVEAPDCLRCFINGGHPHSNNWPWPEGDGTDYTWVYLRIIVPGSHEDIQQGDEVISSGRLEMHLRGQHNYLPTGYEEAHNVRANADLRGDAVRISRVGDSWTVDATVHQMTFFERYRGCGRRNPQGKCVGTWAYIYPLWADIAEPLHFRATWTRTFP